MDSIHQVSKVLAVFVVLAAATQTCLDDLFRSRRILSVPAPLGGALLSFWEMTERVGSFFSLIKAKTSLKLWRLRRLSLDLCDKWRSREEVLTQRYGGEGGAGSGWVFPRQEDEKSHSGSSRMTHNSTHADGEIHCCRGNKSMSDAGGSPTGVSEHLLNAEGDCRVCLLLLLLLLLASSISEEEQEVKHSWGRSPAGLKLSQVESGKSDKIQTLPPHSETWSWEQSYDRSCRSGTALRSKLDETVSSRALKAENVT